MKRILLAVLMLCVVSITVSARDMSSGSRFRYYMHEIYKNYRNVYVSMNTGRYDVTDIHLEYLEGYFSRIPSMIPEKNREGKKLNREKLAANAERAGKAVTELRKALQKGDSSAMSRLKNEIFEACMECHTQAEVKSLSRTPENVPLFAEYMHEISSNFTLAKLYMETDMPDEAVDHLKIINHYFQLLQSVFPDEGITGVIMDRESFRKKMKEYQGLSELMQDDIIGKKTANFDLLKKNINEICMACH